MYPVPGKLRQLVGRLRGEPVEYDCSSMQPLLQQINALEDELKREDDVELRKRAERLRAVHREESVELDSSLVEAFALVREVAARVVKMRPFDVQLLAAISLHEGKIVEMQTGEGKTLAAVMPIFLNALSGKGAHVLTFNDYLARRDALWMGPIFEFLGLTVGFVQEGMTIEQRKEAWAADVTYATAKEAGFDFLRDQLALDTTALVQRPFHFAIVDEADSILIDEARIPLVIAGGQERSRIEPHEMAALVRDLQQGLHFDTDEYQRVVHLTDEGQELLETRLQRGELHAAENRDLLAGLQIALHALILLHKDVDYIVRDGKIELVDEFTGRVVDDRQWPDGIQAALEAKEGLELQPEGQILGSISLQHLMRQYTKLAGMTGTARPAEAEFFAFYGMSVVVIPTHRPCQRFDEDDLLFSHKEAGRKAIVAEIQRCQRRNRPVLVGTCSVEESEVLSLALRDAGVEHEVLNARTDELEAEIISKAGLPGAVTISTNMAGRGVDIKLGGPDELYRDEVVDVGGLYVIGTNRHESVRVDYQLRGRAGRQGDPGTSRFFVSLEDPLIARFGVKQLIPAALLPANQDEPLENPVIRREVERTQRIVEGENLEIRKTLFKYSSFLEKERSELHGYRRALLCGEETPRILEELNPELFAQFADVIGSDELRALEVEICLLHLDSCWAEHLARIADIREGIHLQSAGGVPPLVVFCKQVAQDFDEMSEEFERKVVETFAASRLIDGTLELERSGLERPSSTWTYLINDDTFDKGLGAMFRGVGTGFSAMGAFLLIPIAVGWALWRKWIQRATSRHR